MAEVGADAEALGICVALLYSRVVVAVPVLTAARFLPVSGFSQTGGRTSG